MERVHTTRIGDSLQHEGVLYGSMLSEKYGKDFLEVIKICEQDGAKKLYGEVRITNFSFKTTAAIKISHREATFFAEAAAA